MEHPPAHPLSLHAKLIVAVVLVVGLSGWLVMVTAGPELSTHQVCTSGVDSTVLPASVARTAKEFSPWLTQSVSGELQLLHTAPLRLHSTLHPPLVQSSLHEKSNDGV